jgi:hypothetical protein
MDAGSDTYRTAWKYDVRYEDLVTVLNMTPAVTMSLGVKNWDK